MEKEKNKFLQTMNTTYQKIVSVEKELNEGFKQVNPDEKTDKLNLGAKMLMLSQLNTELMNTISLYIDVMDGKIDELSKEVKDYYNQIEDLKKPLTDSDPEDIKKIKEYINGYKKAE